MVFVGGLTGDVEGEEMTVNYPGFAGGDRTDMRLPSTQRKLLEALHQTGKPVVLVLTTGSALAVDWAKQNLAAILVAWYPGQRGGNAVAHVLFGDANPAGRLPVTFYKADEKLPPFDDYAMQGRTYRYFGGEALYPFAVIALRPRASGIPTCNAIRTRAGAGDEIKLSVQVSNRGERAGDEVVQLYLRRVQPGSGGALKDLRGFQRINLQPGESRKVEFAITPERDLRVDRRAGKTLRRRSARVRGAGGRLQCGYPRTGHVRSGGGPIAVTGRDPGAWCFHRHADPRPPRPDRG